MTTCFCSTRVKSGYHFITNLLLHDNDTPEWAHWTSFWKLNIPPKIKTFIWKACNDYLPNRDRWLTKGIQVSNNCVICGQYGEHVFRRR